jgi:hypothetical protein
MHITRKLKHPFEDTANVWTPLQNSCNSSINGHRYTSMFPNVTNSFLGMFKANIKKYHLMTNQGSKLQLRSITSQVEWQELKSQNMGSAHQVPTPS